MAGTVHVTQNIAIDNLGIIVLFVCESYTNLLILQCRTYIVGTVMQVLLNRAIAMHCLQYHDTTSFGR